MTIHARSIKAPDFCMAQQKIEQAFRGLKPIPVLDHPRRLRKSSFIKTGAVPDNITLVTGVTNADLFNKTTA